MSGEEYYKAMNSLIQKRLQSADVRQVRAMVRDEGLMISTLRELCPSKYKDDSKGLDILRGEYLYENSDKAKGICRINIFVCGGTKQERNEVTNDLVRIVEPKELTPEHYPLRADNYTFIADRLVPIEHSYDGEPLIVWKNYRAKDFLDEFGNIYRKHKLEGLFGLFAVKEMFHSKGLTKSRTSGTGMANSLNIIADDENFMVFSKKLGVPLSVVIQIMSRTNGGFEYHIYGNVGIRTGDMLSLYDYGTEHTDFDDRKWAVEYTVGYANNLAKKYIRQYMECERNVRKPD